LAGDGDCKERMKKSDREEEGWRKREREREREGGRGGERGGGSRKEREKEKDSRLAATIFHELPSLAR